MWLLTPTQALIIGHPPLPLCVSCTMQTSWLQLSRLNPTAARQSSVRSMRDRQSMVQNPQLVPKTWTLPQLPMCVRILSTRGLILASTRAGACLRCTISRLLAVPSGMQCKRRCSRQVHSYKRADGTKAVLSATHSRKSERPEELGGVFLLLFFFSKQCCNDLTKMFAFECLYRAHKLLH